MVVVVDVEDGNERERVGVSERVLDFLINKDFIILFLFFFFIWVNFKKIL